MNPNYEILEQILRLDVEAGAATASQRAAQAQLAELAKKSKATEELIQKSRTDMSFLEGELRRQYRRVDELEERRTDRQNKLFAARTDDEHRSLKREVDNLERDLRDMSRRAEDTEARIEQLKSILIRAEADLTAALSATADERAKAESAEGASKGRLQELAEVRDRWISRLDDRLQQHYARVTQITRNPNGPIARVIGQACSNCHMGISFQQMNSIARAKDVEFCPTCHHLLLPESKA